MPGACEALPPLAEDFALLAEAYDIRLDTLIQNLLFRPNLPAIPLTVVPGVRQPFDWLAGHGRGLTGLTERGPRTHYTAMVVGKCLGFEEARQREMFCGKSGALLFDFMTRCGLKDYNDIYLTSLLKTVPLKPGKFSAGWVKSQAPFLSMELWLTRPKYVLALGADVAKWFTGRVVKMADIENQWQTYTMDLRESADEEVTEQNQFTCQVLPCMSPAALEYESKPEDEQRIVATIRTFATAVTGKQEATKTLPHYPVVRTYAELEKYCELFVSESTLGLIAVDAEWQGAHPQNAGSYLRCVQFAWAPGKSIVLSLTDTEGNPDFEGPDGQKTVASRMAAFALLTKTFNRGLRIAGFFFPADYEWLSYFGWDPSPWYEAADTVEDCKTKGGFALELAAAAVDELSRNSLDSNRWRYTDVPAYEHVLHEYVKAKKEEAQKAKDEELYKLRDSGYGWIPEEILYTYAGADTDVTLQATFAVMAHLDSDRFGCDCWLPYFNALQASLVAAEIMSVGLPFDTRRCVELAVPYAEIHKSLVARLRQILRWPEFNPASPPQVVEALYGKKYSTKRNEYGDRISTRPPGARTLAIEPVLDNDTRSPKLWAEVVAEGLENLRTPGTNAKTIGVLANDPAGVPVRRLNAVTGRYESVYVPEVDGLTLIKDVRTIDQLRKTFIGKYVEEPDGGFSYSGGLVEHVCDDGFVRCFISMVKETGRWSAARPNLHATPKRKEDRYQKVAGSRYPGKMRSVFLAPEGYVIIECDYSSAELFMLAAASGDATLWDHCQRNGLPSDHPDFIDVHATICVRGLNLPCEPTKKGLKGIGKGYMRDVAKCFAAGELIGTQVGWVDIAALCRKYLHGLDQVKLEPGEFAMQAGSSRSWLRGVFRSGRKECFAVRSSLGYEVRASADHRHFVMRRGKLLELTKDELTTDDYVLLYPKTSASDSQTMSCPSALREAASRLPCRQSGVEAAFDLGLLAASTRHMEVRQQGSLTGLFVPLADKVRAGVCREKIQAWSEGEELGIKVPNLALLVGESASAFVSAGVEFNWSGIPSVVFTWSREDRIRFLAGYLMVVSRGSVRWPTAVCEEARQLQQLMLSVGLTTQRKGKVLSPTSVSLDWWSKVVVGGSCDLRDGGYLSSTVPWVAKALSVLYDTYIAHVPESQKPATHTSRKVCLEWLNRVEGGCRKLSPNGKEALSGIRFMLNGGAVFDRIDSIESVGICETFDVETSPQHRHMVVSGGVGSHNSIVYGWAYGRQAKAIVIQAKEEGVIITESEAETIVNGLENLYPDGARYLTEAMARVDDGFLYTPLGRVRRCPASSDRRTRSKYGREFKNAPIQGGVADVVNKAGHNLRVVRREEGMRFRIANQVHDAYIFLVPVEEVPHMVDYVLPEAMSRRVPIIPRRLDGTMPTNVEPKFMNIGTDVCIRWGDTPTDDELLARGISPSLVK